MFQYAAGHALAYRHGTELRLDLSFYHNLQPGHTPRNYLLNSFKITAQAVDCSGLSIDDGQSWSHWGGVLSGFRAIAGSSKLRQFREPDFAYTPDFERLPDNVYLDGYWQSERYFASVADIIRTEFSLDVKMRGRNAEIAHKITTTESISVHVRRGDYVTDPSIASVYQVCGAEYFHHCMELIVKDFPAAHFFIFSDDQEWVRSNLSPKFRALVVDYIGPEKAVYDLSLMSMCRHNIISNSSFSWWGAWLNANPGKIVYAPLRWFRKEGMEEQSPVPTSWRTL